MQVNTQNIQRPALFSDFFGLELLWNNDYLSYINSGIKNVTSTLHKIVKTSTNNIKKMLKTKKFITGLTILIAFNEIKQINTFREVYLSKFHNLDGIKFFIAKCNFIESSPLSHNNALSLI